FLNEQLNHRWFRDSRIDWNLDSRFVIDLALDISSYKSGFQTDYGKRTVLYGFDDWRNLVFRGGSIGARSFIPPPDATEDTEPQPLPKDLFRPWPPLGLALR